MAIDGGAVTVEVDGGKWAEQKLSAEGYADRGKKARYIPDEQTEPGAALAGVRHWKSMRPVLRIV